jgi:hypothetical protein
LYTAYNIIGLLIILFIVFFLNSFINELLIPDSIKSNFNREMLIRFLLALVEGVCLILILRQVNRKYLSQQKVESTVASTASNSLGIVYWTTLIELILLVGICAIAFYAIYEHDR